MVHPVIVHFPEILAVVSHHKQAVPKNTSMAAKKTSTLVTKYLVVRTAAS